MANEKFDPAKTPGQFGQPPAHAPQQVTLPGSERPTHEQIARARENEQELATFAPRPMTPEQIKAFLGKDPSQIVLTDGPRMKPPTLPAPTELPVPVVISTAAPAERVVTSSVKPVDIPLRRRVVGQPRPSIEQTVVETAPAVETVAAVAAETAPTVIALPDDPIAAEPDGYSTEPLAELPPSAQGYLAPPLPHQKAASNTDSPSRGVPRPIDDPGKRITGGFGDLGEAQYFPLDGTEVGEVVRGLLSAIDARIADDLRFSMAVTYPRVKVRVIVEVEAFGLDKSLQIIKVARPHDKTPVDVARQHSDEVCFVLVEERVEMTDDGQSVHPPNALRKELDLPIPRKQLIDTPGGRMFIDIPVGVTHS